MFLVISALVLFSFGSMSGYLLLKLYDRLTHTTQTEAVSPQSFVTIFSNMECWAQHRRGAILADAHRCHRTPPYWIQSNSGPVADQAQPEPPEVML